MDLRTLAQKLQEHPYYQSHDVVLGELVTSLKRIMKAHGLSLEELGEGIRIVCADPVTYYFPLGAFNQFAFRNQVCALTDTAEEFRARKHNEREIASSDWKKTQAYWDRQLATDPVLRDNWEQAKRETPEHFMVLYPDGHMEYADGHPIR